MELEDEQSRNLAFTETDLGGVAAMQVGRRVRRATIVLAGRTTLRRWVVLPEDRDGPHEFTITLAEPIAVRGQVIAFGRPVAHQSVTIASGASPVIVRTKADGSFATELPGPGIYEFSVDVDGEGYVVEHGVSDTPGGAYVEVLIEASELVGRVVDADGSLVAGCPCTLTGHPNYQAVSNASGEIRFGSVAHGEYELVCEMPGRIGLPVRLLVEPNPEPITYRFAVDATLLIRFTEPAVTGSLSFRWIDLEFHARGTPRVPPRVRGAGPTRARKSGGDRHAARTVHGSDHRRR